MKLVTILLLAALSKPAFAQTPVAGEAVDSFDLIPSRTVFFSPTGDGKLKINRVVDNNRSLAIPKTPGEVGVGMTFAQEIGTMLEFNSGLDFSFTYALTPIASDGTVAKPLEVCSVGKGLIGAEQWPVPYATLTLSAFKRHDGQPTC